MENLYQHIALTLKILRKERGWSLDKAAHETGVSKAMLGQIEREESSPTIATLWKIAKGFHQPFSSFISTNNHPLSPQTEIPHPTDKKIRVLPLFPFDAKLGFEMFVIELLPTCEHLSAPHAQGVIEHIVVTEGNMEVLIKGTWQMLQRGEGLRFDANEAHGYRNLSNQTVCFHNIIHYPHNLD